MNSDYYKYQINKDVQSARMFSLWSFTGILIPPLGWILGSIALAKIASIPENELTTDLKVVNSKSKKLAKISLTITTILFIISAVIGFSLGLLISNGIRQEQTNSVTQEKIDGRTACIAEAEKLNVPVREQLPDENIYDYWNYKSSINYAENNASTECYDTYGYPNSD